MPKTSEMRESKFLKKDDVGDGIVVTIESCVQENVAKEGVEPQYKWCLTFAELEKPLVLNSTNIQICEKLCGSDDTDDWAGHKVVLYNDPNVSYQGKLIGGIRVRAPKKAAAPAQPVAAAAGRPARPRPAPAPAASNVDDDDSVPF